MSVSALPSTTNPPSTTPPTAPLSGGIVKPDFKIPLMPAEASSNDLFNNRIEATKLLMAAGSGNLKGGGRKMKGKTKYKKSRNHIVKVMKGCNTKRTKKNKRIFRGGNMVTPTKVANEIEIIAPDTASKTQIGILKSLTDNLFKTQVLATNIPPAIPQLEKSRFAGGGYVNKSRHKNKKTNQKRLRYKRSIGRRSRSRRHKHRS
jgi:hypothetical protein